MTTIAWAMFYRFMEKKKAVGSRGSWFATVDGESLPCVHKYWTSPDMNYDDRGLADSPKARELVEAIKASKQVILTTGDPIFGADQKVSGFRRTGYIAIYAVDDVEFDEAGLRFKFADRLTELA